ncbi:peptidase inhibitor family I36 protein [Streptomyces sp. ISL-90]|nr:peptidase inhibitor family I36 protein [Streptomyces sp. ISL-90]
MNLQTIGAVLATVIAFAPGNGLNPAAHAGPPTPRDVVHCAVEVQPTADGATAEPVCFDTRAEVDGYLQGALAADDNSRMTAAASSTILGRVYTDVNGGGSSLTFWGSSGCYGVTFGFASLPSGWNNTISSAGGSNGCWVTLYTETSYGGSRLNCTPWCGSMGSWNDRTKSIIFRPTGTFG